MQYRNRPKAKRIRASSEQRACELSNGASRTDRPTDPTSERATERTTRLVGWRRQRMNYCLCSFRSGGETLDDR